MRGHHLRHPSKTNDDDPDLTRPISAGLNLPIGGGVGIRKKGTGIRAWLVLDATGQTQIVEAGKHAIMRRTGLPARDLRILDPMLSYPSTILGRERAIVINLEHIKAIITAQEVLLLNSRDPSVTPFVEELQRRILRHHQAIKAQEGDGDDSNWKKLYDSEELQSRDVSPRESTMGFMQLHDQDEEGKAEGKQELQNRDGIMKLLPFEFVALEACLEAACSVLENEAKTLEQEAHPALDKLTSKISTLNLERVRQIKSRLVAITGRVQKVRDELEHLLDDDEDMAEMYLTDKLQEQLENSSASSMNDGEDTYNHPLQQDISDRMPPEISLETGGGSAKYEDNQIPDNSRDQILGSMNVLGRNSHGTRTSTTYSTVAKQLDVEELEMLLEAYFVQIDGTLNKLSTDKEQSKCWTIHNKRNVFISKIYFFPFLAGGGGLRVKYLQNRQADGSEELREYVDDTEDYINIMLDDKQNHLLQMGVMLTTATMVVSAFVVVAGIFGMNIHIELFEDGKSGMHEFLWTVGGGTAGTIFLYVFAIAWCKHKRLLE